jgi:hypothetical protein
MATGFAVGANSPTPTFTPTFFRCWLPCGRASVKARCSDESYDIHVNQWRRKAAKDNGMFLYFHDSELLEHTRLGAGHPTDGSGPIRPTDQLMKVHQLVEMLSGLPYFPEGTGGSIN